MNMWSRVALATQKGPSGSWLLAAEAEPDEVDRAADSDEETDQ